MQEHWAPQTVSLGPGKGLWGPLSPLQTTRPTGGGNWPTDCTLDMASLKVISRMVLKDMQPKPPGARGYESPQPAGRYPSGRREGQVPGSQAVNGTGSTGLTTGRMWHFKCGQQGPGSLTGQKATRLAARPGNQLVKQAAGQNSGDQKYPQPWNANRILSSGICVSPP